MLLVQMMLSNRPGTLGAVASALGAIDADINLVEIVDRRVRVALVDFILDLPPSRTVESLVAVCDDLPGVQVEWVRNYPRGGGIELDVALHQRMAADARRAGETLATAAPLVFRAQWSVLLEVSEAPQVIFAGPGAPHLGTAALERFGPFDTVHRVVLEPGWLPGWDAHHAVVAPLAEHQAVVIGRLGEPAFFTSELARLAHLVGWVDDTEGSGQAGPPARAAEPGRNPVATPLYLRPPAPIGSRHPL